jgi:hypothetical protein
MKKQLLLAIVILGGHVCSLWSQQANTLYFMDRVPQTNLLNPAVQISCKYYVGIPLLSSFHFNLSSTGFSYNTIYGGDKIISTSDLDNVVKKSHRVDMLSSELQINLLALGYRWSDYYFTFNVIEKAGAYASYPGSALELAWYGNSRYIGETVNLNNLRANLDYYREYSLGVSKVISDYLTFGVRAKLLFGKANVYTAKSQSSITTDAKTWNLEGKSEIEIKTSLPVDYTFDQKGFPSDISVRDVNIASFLMNGANKGFAADMGFIYSFDEKITLSGSLLDLGFIRWKTDAMQLLEQGSYTFSGFGKNTNFTDLSTYREMIDTIQNSFLGSHKSGAYFSFLAPKLYTGATYKVNNWFDAGLLLRNEIFRNKLHSSVSLLGLANVKFLSASLSWSYLNNSLANVGVGLGLIGKNLQFHIATDNAWGFYKYLDSRNFNLNFGLNLQFGCGGKASTRNGKVYRGSNGNCNTIENRVKKNRHLYRRTRK